MVEIRTSYYHYYLTIIITIIPGLLLLLVFLLYYTQYSNLTCCTGTVVGYLVHRVINVFWQNNCQTARIHNHKIIILQQNQSVNNNNESTRYISQKSKLDYNNLLFFNMAIK